MSKFWEFNQNNSGGKFDFNLKKGITHYVLIEADTRDQASARAQDIGIYFDGCANGQDCSCCGDRWYEPYGDGDDEPAIYGKRFDQWGETLTRWMEKGRECCVHYLDGRKEWV